MGGFIFSGRARDPRWVGGMCKGWEVTDRGGRGSRGRPSANLTCTEKVSLRLKHEGFASGLGLYESIPLRRAWKHVRNMFTQRNLPISGAALPMFAAWSCAYASIYQTV